MKVLIRCLIVVFAIVILIALYDSFFNGLFSGDGYKPVTEQMKEVISWLPDPSPYTWTVKL